MRTRSYCCLWLLGLSLFCAPAAAQEPGRPDDVVAVLNGEPIYRRDVAPAIGFQLYRLQADMYRLLKRETEAQVERRLLEREAARRGIGVEELLKAEIEAKVRAPGPQEIDAYLAEHPSEGLDAETRRNRARSFLNQRALNRRRIDFMNALRAGADYRFLLAPPQMPRCRVDVDGQPWRGQADAAVTIVQFSNYTSPLDSQSDRAIRQLMAEFPGRVKWVHRTFITRIDETALAAAKIGEWAQEKGRFWPFHDALSALGGGVSQADVERIAREVGLDMDAFREADRSDALLSKVRADLEAGRKLGITSTPVLFINGLYFSGTFPYSQLRQLVEEELATQGGNHAK
jgi:protein-disulfide isomerase